MLIDANFDFQARGRGGGERQLQSGPAAVERRGLQEAQDGPKRPR